MKKALFRTAGLLALLTGFACGNGQVIPNPFAGVPMRRDYSVTGVDVKFNFPAEFHIWINSVVGDNVTRIDFQTPSGGRMTIYPAETIEQMSPENAENLSQGKGLIDGKSIIGTLGSVYSNRSVAKAERSIRSIRQR